MTDGMHGCRYEYKYSVSEVSALRLIRRLSLLLPRDANSRADGSYMIRSLYFDDYASSAYFDKLAGTPLREKYRLRYYNLDPSYIVFECKRKRGDMIQKTGVRVSRSTAARMILGQPLSNRLLSEPLLAAFEAERSARLLRPKVLVDYDRTAFTYPVSHVRITLDRRVRSGLYRTDTFFDPLPSVPVLADGEAILEVKFDRFLAPFLATALSGVPAVHVASSKYCACVAPSDI